MMRAATGHPLRAFAALLVVVAAWLGARAPAMRADFTAGLTQARAARDAPLLAEAARSRRLREQAIVAAPPPPRLQPVETRRPLPLAVVAEVAEAGSHRRIARKPAAPDRDVAARSIHPDAELVSSPVLVVAEDVRPASLLPPTAAAFATAGYARLAAADRRDGARLLGVATVIAGDPRVGAWARDRNTLLRRWSGSAYLIARDGIGDIATTPVLGGGQVGAALAYTLDPLARRPVFVGLRATAATRRMGLDGDAAQAAFGVTWRALPSASISVERLVPLGDATRAAWALRVAGGTSGRRFGVDASIYAEAGRVGHATYGAAQARGDVPVPLGARVVVHPGGGAWASLQHDARTIGRVDAGPGIRLTSAALPVEISVDYRVRLTGNAAPGSGPVVTVSTSF